VFSSTNQACYHKLVHDSLFNFRIYFVLLIRVFNVLNYLIEMKGAGIFGPATEA
jgi:hypothetical protein